MTRLNLASGIYVINGPGWVNHDPVLDGWRFEHGLGQYADGSVEGISECHGLMHLPLAEWPALFAEMARVLEPGGVLRITEDSTADPASERFGGYEGAVTLTTPERIVAHMEAAGLVAEVVGPYETAFRDDSLCQRLHGGMPKVTFVEGVKPRT